MNKKCRNNKPHLRDETRGGIGICKSVHKLVQFCCVTVGKPLGCQLACYLEDLEYEAIIKLGFLFQKYFESLW